MRLRLSTLAAGPAGVMHPGLHEVADSFGKQLVSAGVAVAVDEQGQPIVRPARRQAAALERADLPLAPETATSP